jgi:hypothetical protein
MANLTLVRKKEHIFEFKRIKCGQSCNTSTVINGRVSAHFIVFHYYFLLHRTINCQQALTLISIEVGQGFLGLGISRVF